MVGIKKIYIFVFKSFGLLFVGTFFICLFVFMMQFLWRYVDELIGKGLTMDVLAQFFYYAALTMIPMSLPLAILLASLITFGNLGERFELLAMKAAGIPLLTIFRPLIIFVLLMACVSIYFQNVIGPNATLKLRTLLISMKQKSPELDIPEGIFYNEIKGYNLFVQKKNKDTGVMHGVMIYMNTDNFEDAQIVLADSATLRMTGDRQHLLLSLYSGERFRNMQSQAGVSTYANVPYMRETFMHETDLIPFSADFNMMDASVLSGSANSKNMKEIRHSIDSMNATYDSIGRRFYAEAQRSIYKRSSLDKKDSLLALKKAGTVNVDTVFSKLSAESKFEVINRVRQHMDMANADMDYKRLVMADGDKTIRYHWVEWFQKITLSLSCIIFFFIGAPLGAIIRKGGLGMPVIISVGIFIFYYIIDFSGMKMAKAGQWSVWFGMWISTIVLTPIAVFFTYKANNDSMVFNFEIWRTAFRKAFGLRNTRSLSRKEVIIEDPDYTADSLALHEVRERCETYISKARLRRAPNYWRLFFRYREDKEVESINNEMEAVVDNLSNTRNPVIINELNKLPVIAVKAHTRPFDTPWMNVAAGIILPVGLFFYLRMSRFRWRLNRDLQQICISCRRLARHCNVEAAKQVAVPITGEREQMIENKKDIWIN